MSGGKRTFGPGFLGLWLAACLPTAVSAKAADEGADGADGTQASDEKPSRDPSDIVVFGRHADGALAGVTAQDELDRNQIDAYGLDTIGQLVEQIGSELQPGEDGPIVLINGYQSTGINDISDLPVEAATKVQILPKAVAGRLGYAPTRRVINVMIKPNLVQVTPRAKASLATRGDAFQAEAELNLLRLSGGNRRSLVVRAIRTDPLLESQRDLISDTAAVPYALPGNVIGSGGPGSEIDPALSALAGTSVATAAVPRGMARPALADFAKTAGSVNPTDLGTYRTLVSGNDTITVNASASQRLSGLTSIFVNAKFEYSSTEALRGQSQAMLVLPPRGTFSPFTRPVSLAYLIGDPLRSSQDVRSLDLAQVLNTRIGKFGLSARVNYAHRVIEVAGDRGYDLAALQAGIDAGLLNPFTDLAGGNLGPMRTDRTRAVTDTVNVQLSTDGTLLMLPAGPLLLSAALRARLDRSASERLDSGIAARRFNRDEIGARGNLSIPLFADDERASRITADLTGELHKHSGSGALRDYAFTLTADFGRALNLSAAFAEEEVAPPVGSVNDPFVVSENFRAYDFVRQETVLVRSISGGNPDLPIQRKRSFSVQANWRPIAGKDLVIGVDYSHLSNRDVFAALPPVSASVQLAFADRFVRDASGRLIEVDARPVTFAKEGIEKLRWSLRYRSNFGQGAVLDESDDSAATVGRGFRFNFDVTHDWTLRSTRQARAALPVVDLLRGGAIGYGGGLVRHVVTANAGIAGRGLGLQVDAQWRGGSYVVTGTEAAPGRLTFDDRLLIGARLFANLGPLLPDQRWAHGLRMTLQATNLLDSRQEVRDESGQTPQRYQAFLIDPVGRTVSLSLRKVF